MRAKRVATASRAFRIRGEPFSEPTVGSRVRFGRGSPSIRVGRLDNLLGDNDETTSFASRRLPGTPVALTGHPDNPEKGSSLKIVRVLCIAASSSVPASALAQSCSGGPDGGMDATGNQYIFASSTTGPPPNEVGMTPDQPQRFDSCKLVSERRAALPNAARASSKPRIATLTAQTR